MSQDILVKEAVRQMRSDMKTEKKLISYGFGSHQVLRMLVKYLDLLCDHDWQPVYPDEPVEVYASCRHCHLRKLGETVGP